MSGKEQELATVKAVRKTLKDSKSIDKLLKKKEKLEAKLQKLNIKFMEHMEKSSSLGMNSTTEKIYKTKGDLVKVLEELKRLDALRGGSRRRKTRRSTKRN